MAALLGGDKKVINSGVILATPAAMLLHVDALVDEMWALGGRYDRWMVGVDQAAHMLLVYRNRTRHDGAKGKRKRGRREPRFEIATLLPRAIGSVLHVSDVNPSDYKIDEHGVVRTTAADGAAYTMVHRNWPPLELGTPHPPAKSADPVFASLWLLSQSGTERHMPCRMASAGHGQATESACRYERRKAVHGGIHSSKGTRKGIHSTARASGPTLKMPCPSPPRPRRPDKKWLPHRCGVVMMT